jgi:NAD(P)-dependent dehydrogenase (short-subunit alcohol dehydrogenase family)
MGEVKESSNAADEKELHGNRILVTGGTRGIGAAIVDRLTAGGGQLITTGRSGAE